MEFVVLPHRESKDVFILGGVDDIQACLDDSQVSEYVSNDLKKDWIEHVSF